MRAGKFGDEFGGFVEEIVWSDIVGEEQDNLVDVYKRLFGGKLLEKSRRIWRRIW
jgi:hypothetical protein